MTTHTDLWRTESQPGPQALAALGLGAVGLALTVALRHAGGPGFDEARAGFWLGVLLLALGVGVGLSGGRQVITVDTRRRLVTLEHHGRLGSRRTVIPFADITDVAVAELGDAEGGSIRYHLAVRLRDGRTVALFLGFFEGAHSRQATQARCERLLICLRAGGTATP